MKGNRWVHKITLLLCVCMLVMSGSMVQVSAKQKLQDGKSSERVSIFQAGQIHIQKGYVRNQGFEVAPTSTQSFYKELRKKLLKRSTQIRLKYQGNPKEVLVGIDEILENVRRIDDKTTSDDADFLVGSITSMGYSVTYEATRAEFDFVVRYTENTEQVAKVNKKISQILKSLKVNQLSEVGKVKAIHDYVVNRIDYDRTMIDHSVYGGLIAEKHTTVCQGYALLMYKMLTDAGVRAHYVTGYAGEAHAWNEVMIDGKWYYIDATWDDPTGGRPILSHEYFLIGSNKLSRDHRIDAVYSKLYPAEKKDYNWRKALENSSKKADKTVNKKETKQQIEMEEEAKSRNEYIHTLTQILDESLDYEGASEMEKTLYDLYKKVFACVVRDLPRDQFNKLVAGDDEFYDKFYQICSTKMDKYILDPCSEYLNSEECFNATLDMMLEDYEYEEIECMDEDEIAALAETYAMIVINRKISGLSMKYTKQIIRECVEELE